MVGVNYVLRLFEGYINPGYPTRIKLYLQATKEIDQKKLTNWIFKFQIPKTL